MVDGDWGLDEDPAWFGVRGLDWVAVDSDKPDDVAEVAAARRSGYFPAHEAPMWCFLPALWPREARAWVRDRRVRHGTRSSGAGPVERVPWTAADYADDEAGTNRFLTELGLPPRPAGRIWVLRPPTAYPTLDAVLGDLWDGWIAAGEEPMATREFVTYVAGRMHELF